MEPFWQILADPTLTDRQEIDTESYHLPGVTCGACGNTWSAFSRSAVTVFPKYFYSRLSHTPRPCDLRTWREIANSLRPFLPPTRQDDSLQPGMQVGQTKVKHLSACDCDVIWTGFGNCFFQNRILYELRDCFDPIVLFAPCEPANIGITELIPVMVDLHGFGEKTVCESCGLSQTDDVDIIGALNAFRIKTGIKGLFIQMPGMKVVDEWSREKIERRKVTNVLFRELL